MAEVISRSDKSSEHEEIRNVLPEAILYRCEFCNDGYMMSDSSDSPNEFGYPHRCNKCKKKMYLPKVYPYIKWIIDGIDG